MQASSARRAIVAAAAALATVASGASAASAPTAVLLAVGDVASCASDGDERVAGLLARTQGTIAILGDIVYENGTEEEFERCFLPSFGAFVPRIRPALGNHDYAHGSSRAEAAKRVFGLGSTWYSYELGSWHVIVLDSNCALVGSCKAGARQWRWLRRDLASHRGARCTLAYWHHARFSSGRQNQAVAPLWRLLVDGGADVVLAGHDHHYERFAPIEGIRSFVVGTGGRSLRPTGQIHPRSAARQTESYGVVRLTLRRDGYSWRFLTAAGPEFRDAGSARCR